MQLGIVPIINTKIHLRCKEVRSTEYSTCLRSTHTDHCIIRSWFAARLFSPSLRNPNSYIRANTCSSIHASSPPWLSELIFSLIRCGFHVKYSPPLLPSGSLSMTARAPSREIFASPMRPISFASVLSPRLLERKPKALTL